MKSTCPIHTLWLSLPERDGQLNPKRSGSSYKAAFTSHSHSHLLCLSPVLAVLRIFRFTSVPVSPGTLLALPFLMSSSQSKGCTSQHICTVPLLGKQKAKSVLRPQANHPWPPKSHFFPDLVRLSVATEQGMKPTCAINNRNMADQLGPEGHEKEHRACR